MQYTYLAEKVYNQRADGIDALIVALNSEDRHVGADSSIL
jgi:hypothetical protein